MFQLVLLVGASHLRSIADGIVPMPEDRYTFGVMSTPGACADQLRTEVEHAVLPRIPDAVCVIAPSNNLTASTTPETGGVAFGRYLATVCSVWPTAQVGYLCILYNEGAVYKSIEFCNLSYIFSV